MKRKLRIAGTHKKGRKTAPEKLKNFKKFKTETTAKAWAEKKGKEYTISPTKSGFRVILK